MEGTFTGFVQSLWGLGITLSITPTGDRIVISASRQGKTCDVTLNAVQLMEATLDVASVELGELISALL
jgi:hypothetical protein